MKNINNNLTDIASISATTYYGDGSGLIGVTASFTGGIVTGQTSFTGGLSATSISATTYYNIPDPAGWTTIVKSANQDVTNSATLVDDTDLQFSVVAGGKYMIELDIAWSANDATGDYKFDYAVSAGLMTGYGIYWTNNVTTIISVNAPAALSSTDITLQTLSAAVDTNIIPLKIVITAYFTASGIFSYRFANAAAGVGRISRTWKGSILRYKRID